MIFSAYTGCTMSEDHREVIRVEEQEKSNNGNTNRVNNFIMTQANVTNQLKIMRTVRLKNDLPTKEN